jgi:hypothetical protein
MATTSFDNSSLAITKAGYYGPEDGFGVVVKYSTRWFFKVTGGRAVRIALKPSDATEVYVRIDGGTETLAGTTGGSFGREEITLDGTTTLGNREYEVRFLVVGHPNFPTYLDKTGTIEVDTNGGDPTPTVGLWTSTSSLATGYAQAIDLRLPPSYVDVGGRLTSFDAWNPYFDHQEGHVRVKGKLTAINIWINDGQSEKLELFEDGVSVDVVYYDGVGGTGLGKWITLHTSGNTSVDHLYYILPSQMAACIMPIGTVQTSAIPATNGTCVGGIDSITYGQSTTDSGEARPFSQNTHGRRLCAMYDWTWYNDGVPFRKVSEVTGNEYSGLSDSAVIAHLSIAGVNDENTPDSAATLQTNATNYLTALVAEKPTTKHIIFGVTYAGATPVPAADYNAAWDNAVAAVNNANVYRVHVTVAGLHPTRAQYDTIIAAAVPVINAAFGLGARLGHRLVNGGRCHSRLVNAGLIGRN